MLSLKSKYFNYVIFFFLSIFIISCSLERKVAQSFVKNEKERSLLLFFPSEMIKTNLKAEQFKLLDSLALARNDSILPGKSLYLDELNDSVFLAQCKKSLIRELKLYGFRVYEISEIDDFIALKDSSYVLDLAQLEIEEGIYKVSSDEFMDVGYYTTDISINSINLNAWFELNRNQMPNERYPVLYASYYIHDEVIGNLIRQPKFSTPKFRYKTDSIDMEDIYKLAEFAGKKYAVNFYDYILNLYIQDHIPKDQTPVYYYHYHRNGKTLQTFYNDSFIEMEK